MKDTRQTLDKIDLVFYALLFAFGISLTIGFLFDLSNSAFWMTCIFAVIWIVNIITFFRLKSNSEETEAKKVNRKLNWLIFFIVVAGLIALSFFVYFKFFNYHYEYSTEKVETLFQSFDYSDEIICEEGMIVKSYEEFGIKVIYGCLQFDENEDCSGIGKVCLIKHRNKVWNK